MEQNTRLPIKIVEPHASDFRQPQGGGGRRKQFGAVTDKVRKRHAEQLDKVAAHFAGWFKEAPSIPAVARVVLKRDALAKSYRPTKLFSDETCPIMGGGRFGELFVGVTRSRLRKLRERILTGTSMVDKANISTIQQIEPFTAQDAVGVEGIDGLANVLEGKGHRLKLRLFVHASAVENARLVKRLLKLTQGLGLPQPDELRYGQGSCVLRLTGVTPDHVAALAGFAGTRSLATFPAFTVVKTASIPVGSVTALTFPEPDPAADYPIIGVVDTGTDPRDPVLAPWVAAREIYVPDVDADFDHGSFVSGLAVYAQVLNDDRFPGHPVKVLDVRAVPKSGAILEDDLLAILEEVIPKYPAVRVWNLSLNTTEVSDDVFSDLAMALDALMDEHGVTIACSAGNYKRIPFRGWPPEDLGEDDRIKSPADAVRAIAVGSLAHLDRPGSRVRREDPSPFTRRGPGAAFLPKPELVHYGGNCKPDGDFTQIGVRSLNGKGNIAEDIGTSFSAPLVANVLANIDGAIQGPVSPCLLRALAIHSAALGNPDLTAVELRYKGFGVPGELAGIVTCAPWEATLIFEPELV
ncbi:S8 family peptidase, partial [Planctomycetota bacterium]